MTQCVVFVLILSENIKVNFFQVLLNGGSDDFMIINYKKLSSAHALSGFSIQNDCKYDVLISPSRSKYLLTSSTNTKTIGRHIIHLSFRECLHRSSEFYVFFFYFFILAKPFLISREKTLKF